MINKLLHPAYSQFGDWNMVYGEIAKAFSKLRSYRVFKNSIRF